MSGDGDPGRLMPPVPKGWQMHSRSDLGGITLPHFTRKDGMAVKFATALGCWAAFLPTGERRPELGTSHTPGGMMAHVDEVSPIFASMQGGAGSSAAGSRGLVDSADGAEFDALFRGMLSQRLFTVGFRDGQMVTELTPKGIAALAILECVKAQA